MTEIKHISEPSPVSATQLNAVEVSLLVNQETAFLAAAMVICNELRTRHQSACVGLGVVSGDSVKLVALSNTKKFNRREARPLAMSHAMEECAEQDEEVQAPRPDDETFVAYEHERYLRQSGEEVVGSVPVRIDGEVFAVITLERCGSAFSASELASLRLTADLVARRLHELFLTRGLGIPKRLSSCRRGLAWVFGVRHTWAKLVAALVVGILLFICFYPWFYRVEAQFELRAAESLTVHALIDGFIDSVHVEPGDIVGSGEQLVSLDTLDFLLVEGEILAKVSRLQTEAEQARGRGEMSQARVLLAEIAEENVRIERVRRQLELASIRAPWDAVVIEGDLRERLGSPVQQGEPLIRLSPLRDLYVRLEIPERTIHDVDSEGVGELAFTSRPDMKFPFRLVRIDPVGTSRPDGTVFLARAMIDADAESWWRPGMSGVAKIDVGYRPLIWVLTHRIIDFLRLKLWI